MLTRALLALSLLTVPAAAQNVFFPANPGDMIVKGTVGAWTAVPGGTAGCMLMSQGPTAAPTWSCALPLNFSLPPMATNKFWGNVSGVQAIPTQVSASDILNSIDYDIQHPLLPGSTLYKGTDNAWHAAPPAAAVGWVWTTQGAGVIPRWAPSGGYVPPGPSGTCLVSTGETTAPVFSTCPTPGAYVASVFGRTGAVSATSGDYTVGQVTGAAPLASPTFTGVPAAPTAAAGTNTTQLATTAFTQNIINTYGGATINVRLPPYNAVGNSSTNDIAALDLAYVALVAAGGGAIILPPSTGCYRIGSTWNLSSVTVPIVVLGSGGSCIDTSTALTEIVRVGPADGSTTRASSAVFSGITIKGGGVGGTVAALRVRNVIYGRFANLRIESPAGTGIWMDANAGSSDPLSQGNLVDNVYVLGAGGRGGYFRGIKSSIFTNLQFDGSTGYGAYWDLENQVAGSNETTENIISNVVAKNGSSAGIAFSGIAKFTVSNLDIYINQGPGILFRPTISGTNAAFGPSVFANLTLRNNGTAGIDTLAGTGAGSLTIQNVMITGTAGAAANGINMKAWFWSNLSNIYVSGIQGSGIVTSDDGTSPFITTPQGINIKNFVCIGQSQDVNANGIDFGGTPQDFTVDGVYTNACAGTSGYEINASSAGASNVKVGNLNLNVNTAAHSVNNPTRLKYFGGFSYVNITPLTVATLPACNAAFDGARAFVTDNNTATAFAGAVTAGGANHHPVYCDGAATAWKQG